MSTPQIQQILTKGSLHEKLLNTQIGSKISPATFRQRSSRSSKIDHDSLPKNSEKIIQKPIPAEELVLKYLGKEEDSSQEIQSDVNNYASALESLEVDETLPRLKKNRNKTSAPEISKTTLNRITAKPMISGKTASFNDCSEVKHKDISTTRERSSAPFARGEYSARKDFKLNQTLKGCESQYHSERMSIEQKFDFLTNKFISSNQRLHSTKKIAIKGLEGLKLHPEREREGAKSKICLPRLVQSDLSDRRTKANLGGTPSRRPDVPRRRPANAPAPTALLRLRESVSDAKVTALTNLRRATRSRKSSAPQRAPKVRSARPLSNFLRAGFHPPEPGTRLPSLPRPPQCQTPLPPSNSDADDDAHAVDSDDDFDSTTELPTAPYPGDPSEGRFSRALYNTHLRAGGEDHGDGDVRPSEVAKKSRHRLRAASTHRDNLPSALVLSPVPAPNHSPRPHACALGSGEIFSRNIASKSVNVSRKCGEQSANSQSVTYPSIPSFLLGIRNRRGRPVSRGPTKYRTVPILKGNLYLTMPSIQEEVESRGSEETQTVNGEDIEEDVKQFVKNTEDADHTNTGCLENCVPEEINKSGKKYWMMLEDLLTTPLHDRTEKLDQLKEEQNLKMAEEFEKANLDVGEGDTNVKAKRKNKENKKTRQDKKDRKMTEKERSTAEEKEFEDSDVVDESEFQNVSENENHGILNVEEKKTERQAQSDRSQTKERDGGGKLKRFKVLMKSYDKNVTNVQEKTIQEEKSYLKSGKNEKSYEEERTKIKEGRNTGREERTEKDKKLQAEESGDVKAATAAAARAEARAGLKKFRRELRRDKQAAAECVAAEAVMARWAKNHEAIRQQRQVGSGAEGAASAPGRRRRRPGSGKNAAGNTETSEKKSDEWQSAKRAVRRGEIMLLARADKLDDFRPAA